jgi:hypothetical protein
MKYKVISLESSTKIDLIRDNSVFNFENMQQIIIFDKDYTLGPPNKMLSRDMLQSLTNLLEVSSQQNRLFVINTSNSVRAVQNDIISALFSFMNSNSNIDTSKILKKFLIYAGPSLSVVNSDTGELKSFSDYGHNAVISDKQIQEIKNSIEYVFNYTEEHSPNILDSFRDFIIQENNPKNTLPFKKAHVYYKWDIPLNIDGTEDHIFSLHIRKGPSDNNKTIQATLNQLFDKKTKNSFESHHMPKGLRIWFFDSLQKILTGQIQAVISGTSSIDFNILGFNSKISAINHLYSHFGITPNYTEVLYVGDEARVLPDGHIGNDAVVYNVEHIKLINVGPLNEGSKSLDAIKLQDYGLIKGRGATLFNMNISNKIKTVSSVDTTLSLINQWFF